MTWGIFVPGIAGDKFPAVKNLPTVSGDKFTTGN
jgi:hypothetical protein